MKVKKYIVLFWCVVSLTCNAAIAVERSRLVQVLRPEVQSSLKELEQTTSLNVVFQSLPQSSAVVATYWFDPNNNTPYVSLGKKWSDEDVAHELVHMRMELLEGFYVLAWKKRVIRTEELEAAFGRIRAYVDDEVVHAKLASAGFKVDGEVLKSQLFDSFYGEVSRFLEEGHPRSSDGMGHLDRHGRGELCRAAFLVQAELILRNYVDQLSLNRVEKTRRFIHLFRAHRPKEASRADRVLELFEVFDVNSVSGHRAILEKWAEMEKLQLYVGPSAYVHKDGRYILPWPE